MRRITESMEDTDDMLPMDIICERAETRQKEMGTRRRTAEKREPPADPGSVKSNEAATGPRKLFQMASEKLEQAAQAYDRDRSLRCGCRELVQHGIIPAAPGCGGDDRRPV